MTSKKLISTNGSRKKSFPRENFWERRNHLKIINPLKYQLMASDLAKGKTSKKSEKAFCLKSCLLFLKKAERKIKA